MKVTDEMVDRFLSWKLPEDFHPDAGISFNPEFNVEYNAKLGLPPARHQPIGTNLLTATQAKAMLEHVLAVAHSATTSFMPTHRHAEGGLYEVLDASLQVQVGGKWMKGVRYRNAEGMEFVRDIYTFDARFTLESASPDRNVSDG